MKNLSQVLVSERIQDLNLISLGGGLKIKLIENIIYIFLE